MAHVEGVLNERAATERDEEYFRLLASGKGRYKAAREVGLEPINVKRRIKMDARFAERVVIAEAESMEEIAEVLRREAKDGDVRSALKLLESKSAEEYGQKAQQVQITVSSDDTETDHITRRIRALEHELLQKAQLNAGVIDIEEDE